MQSMLVRACLGVVVATGLVGAVGCSSSEPSKAVDRRVGAANTADDLRKQLRDADAQVTSTQTTVQRMSTQQSGRLDETFKTLQSDIKRNESISDRISGKSQELTRESSRHVDEWGFQARTITDEGLRQQSLDRQQQARQQHDQTTVALNEVRAAYGKYIRELEDIQTYAAQDLTPQGLGRLRDHTERTDKAAQELRQQFVNLDARLDKLASGWRAEVPLAQRPMDDDAAPAAGQVGDEKANEPKSTTRPIR